MKILVCISNVPDTTTKVKFVDGNTKLDTTGIQWVINPWDELSLTRALELKDDPASGIKSVTVAHVGAATSEPTIRKALAIGADDAIRVNAEPADSYFVAAQLAEVVKKDQFDIILCGIESSDFNGSTVGGMLSEFLAIPSVSAVSSIMMEGSQSVYIYNNTFYNSNPGGPNLCLINNLEGFNFRNNIFVYNGPFLFKGQVIKGELFQNNCYWNLGGDKKFLGYPEIDKWALSNSKEQWKGKSTFVYADPLLNDTSTANIKNPYRLAGLTIFIPTATSPVIDVGYDIRALPGGDEVTKDLAGFKVPQGKGFDIGAMEYFSEK